jgi:hypothetical protein
MSAPSLPRTETCPRSGQKMPPIIFSNVVLPEPLGPMSPTVSPRLTSSDTSSTAQNSLSRSSPELARSPTMLRVTSESP